eukprot:3576502-Amphidinium_carterae.1
MARQESDAFQVWSGGSYDIDTVVENLRKLDRPRHSSAPAAQYWQEGTDGWWDEAWPEEGEAEEMYDAEWHLT